MKPNGMKNLPLLLLIGSALLVSGCKSLSTTTSVAVPPAAIQPLPQSARQPIRSETFLESVEKDMLRWEAKLNALAQQGNSAKGFTIQTSPPSVPNLKP